MAWKLIHVGEENGGIYKDYEEAKAALAYFGKPGDYLQVFDAPIEGGENNAFLAEAMRKERIEEAEEAARRLRFRDRTEDN